MFCGLSAGDQELASHVRFFFFFWPPPLIPPVPGHGCIADEYGRVHLKLVLSFGTLAERVAQQWFEDGYGGSAAWMSTEDCTLVFR